MLSLSHICRIACAAMAAFVLVCYAGAAEPATAPLAPELSGLGNLQMAVTTSVPKAQAFFDQGLRLAYAFNHPEARRAFQEAARLDPELAMAYWGEAYTLGPTLNSPMKDESGQLAQQAIHKAQSLDGSASQKERWLIEALAARYTGTTDTPAQDNAYAEAMASVASRAPDDPDIQTLYADALMNTMRWDYWQKDGSPKPATEKVLAALERTIAKFPDHAGAHHFYIHLVEASDNPDRGVASADKLGSLMPAAGHIVHMPAHIYIRVGRYADASEATARAALADEDYLAQCQAQGLYPISYYPHNVHFLWATATLEGRSAVAIDAARKVAEKTPHHHAGALPWTSDFPVTPLLAYVRFGRWKEILTEPRPPANEPYATGIWHYSRALAFMGRNQPERAEPELTALKATMENEAFSTRFKDLPLLTNLRIASRIVEGELASRKGDNETGIRLLREAVGFEDGLTYNEPPTWHQPSRLVLGALLLKAGRPVEAEQAYREDLKRFRENGWALFGLSQSLEAQKRSAEAADVHRRFEKAWARADIKLTSSRILVQ